MADFTSLDLRDYQQNAQYRQYLAVLNKFLKEYLPKIKHSHAFVTGSFVKGALHQGSDLDVDIIDPHATHHAVKKVTIDGVVLEYAVFSFDMLDGFLDGKYDHPERLADAVSHWKLLDGPSFPTALVEKAKKRAGKP